MIDVLMMLGEDNLPVLENSWRTLQGDRTAGLTMVEFVTLMLKSLPNLEESLNLEMVEALVVLFRQIDIDGDGTLEWSEFSEHCLEVGRAAPQGAKPFVHTRYEEDAMWKAQYIKHPMLIRWVEELQILLVSEQHTQNLKIFDSNCAFLYCFDTNQNMHLVPSNVSKQILDTSAFELYSNHPIVGMEFCPDLVKPQHGYLVTLAHDMKIKTWTLQRMVTGSFRVELVGTVHTRTPQSAVRWCPISQLLYTGDVNGRLNTWTLDDTSGVVMAEKSNAHSAMITDITVCPLQNYMLTVGMDHRIIMWTVSEHVPGVRMSSPSLKQTAEFKGHTLGVNAIAVCQKGEVAVTVGFEHQIYCWSIAGRSLLCKLSGHRAPVFGVQEVLGRGGKEETSEDIDFRDMDIAPDNLAHTRSPRGANSSRRETSPARTASNSTSTFVTGDQSAMFRVWAISHEKCVSGQVECLQTFCTRASMRLQSFQLLSKSNMLYMSGYKIVRFTPKVVKLHETNPVTVVYNSESATFAIAQGRSVYVFDAANKGKLVRSFEDLSGTEITSFFVERRGRKMILGNQGGEVLLLNYSNGAPMKTGQSHMLEVSCVNHLPEHNLVFSASWDRMLCVHDEIKEEVTKGFNGNSDMQLLRSVSGAHKRDITCMCVSLDLCLVATASSDNSIRLWDLVNLNLEGQCTGHGAEATSMLFPPIALAVLVVADCKGTIAIWPVRPRWDRYSAPLCVFQNIHTGTIGRFHSIGGTEFLREAKGTEDSGELSSDDSEGETKVGAGTSKTMRGAKHPQQKRQMGDEQNAKKLCNAKSTRKVSKRNKGSMKSSKKPKSTRGIHIPGTDDSKMESNYRSGGGSGVVVAVSCMVCFDRGSRANRQASRRLTHKASKSSLFGDSGKSCELEFQYDFDENVKAEVAKGEGKDSFPANDSLILCSGDDEGHVRLWDLGKLLQELNVRYEPAERLPSNWASFNPKRKVRRVGEFTNTPIHDRAGEKPDSKCTLRVNRKVSPFRSWLAHTGFVKSITTTGALETGNFSGQFGIATTGNSTFAKVWSSEGASLGVFSTSQGASSSWSESSARWTFPVNTANRSSKLRRYAETILEECKAGLCIEYANKGDMQGCYRIRDGLTTMREKVDMKIASLEVKRDLAEKRKTLYARAVARVQGVQVFSDLMREVKRNSPETHKRMHLLKIVQAGAQTKPKRLSMLPASKAGMRPFSAPAIPEKKGQRSTFLTDVDLDELAPESKKDPADDLGEKRISVKHRRTSPTTTATPPYHNFRRETRKRIPSRLASITPGLSRPSVFFQEQFNVDAFDDTKLTDDPLQRTHVSQGVAYDEVRDNLVNADPQIKERNVVGLLRKKSSDSKATTSGEFMLSKRGTREVVKQGTTSSIHNPKDKGVPSNVMQKLGSSLENLRESGKNSTMKDYQSGMMQATGIANSDRNQAGNLSNHSRLKTHSEESGIVDSGNETLGKTLANEVNDHHVAAGMSPTVTHSHPNVSNSNLKKQISSASLWSNQSEKKQKQRSGTKVFRYRRVIPPAKRPTTAARLSRRIASRPARPSTAIALTNTGRQAVSKRLGKNQLNTYSTSECSNGGESTESDWSLPFPVIPSSTTHLENTTIRERIQMTMEKFNKVVGESLHVMNPRQLAAAKRLEMQQRIQMEYHATRDKELQKLVYLRKLAADMQFRAVRTPLSTLEEVKVDLSILKRNRGFGPYSKDQVERIASLFYDVDQDCSGSIDRKEFVESKLWERYNMGDSSSTLFDSLDEDEDNNITLDEIMTVILPLTSLSERVEIFKYCNALQMQRNIQLVTATNACRDVVGGKVVKMRAKLTSTEVEEIRTLFRIYDSNSDGFLSFMELKDIFAYYPDSGVTQTDLEEMFAEHGKSIKDDLSQDDFVEFMRKSYLLEG